MIADHIRACSFLVVDGVIPSNEGRGYVLRRIARRAMRHGYKFGVGPAFFADLVPTLAKVMGAAYPELVAKQAFVRDVLFKEGEQFARTLENGMEILDAAIAKLGGAKVIDGNTVFKLHDTYGFPTDLTADIARERGLTIDVEGYERAMDVQRKQSQAASQFGVDVSAGVKVDSSTEFLGYDTLESDAPVVALFDARGAARAGARAGRHGHRRARTHTFLRRERRPGRRHRRASRRVRAFCGQRHAEARRGFRPRRHGGGRAHRGRRPRRGARWTRSVARRSC